MAPVGTARRIGGGPTVGTDRSHMKAIYRERPVPVILVSAYHDASLIERAEADHILGYLVKPIKQTDLVPAIALAMRRFEQFEALRHFGALLNDPGFIAVKIQDGGNDKEVKDCNSQRANCQRQGAARRALGQFPHSVSMGARAMEIVNFS